MLLIAACLAAAPFACRAELVPSSDEREIVDWFRIEDPPNDYFRDLRLLVAADEHVRRRFLLERCDKRTIWSGRDRLLNESYRSVVVEVRDRYRTELLDRRSVQNQLMYNYDLVALLFHYRKADIESKAAWLRFMKTSAAREGRNWEIWVNGATIFPDEFAVDVNTGTQYLGWLHWLDGYLRLAKLSDPFARSLDYFRPGLGKEFSGFVSIPIPLPVSAEYRRDMERLGDSVKEVVNAKSWRLAEFLPRDVAANVQTWTGHPMVKAMFETGAQILRNSRQLPERRKYDDAELAAFMLEVRGKGPDGYAVYDKMIAIAKETVTGRCESLR